jgi:hypothetical protein
LNMFRQAVRVLTDAWHCGRVQGERRLSQAGERKNLVTIT